MTASDQGFTLAELLIALAISALVLALAAGGLRMAARMSERSAEIDSMAALAVARGTLTDCIEGAMPVSEVDARGQVRLAFEGGRDRLSLVCLLDGPRRVTIEARGLRDAIALTLAEAPFMRHARDDPGKPHVLSGGIARLMIRYYGEERDGRGLAWRDAWTGGTGRLPLLVGITVELRNGDPRRWPELILRPRVST